MNEMPKMTAKYERALHTALNKVRISPILLDKMSTQEELYTALQQAGYFWDSAAKTWDYHEPEAADEPTALIMVRVWSDSEIIDEAADEIINGVKNVWKLVERSTPYQCRPPKQGESRVYLKFLPR
jgi:hypothetical protein